MTSHDLRVASHVFPKQGLEIRRSQGALFLESNDYVGIILDFRLFSSLSIPNSAVPHLWIQTGHGVSVHSTVIQNTPGMMSTGLPSSGRTYSLSSRLR